MNESGHPAKVLVKKSPPAIGEFGEWKSSNLLGAMFVVFGLSMTAGALWLSTSLHPAVWFSGQILLAVAFVQWFAILHEAGHKTLFRSSKLNYLAGHLSGFFAGFPFESWKLIHGLHHRWTGWQDLDTTTAGLTPRERPRWILIVVRLCWALWIPIFSVIYRLDNYWNLPRLHKLFSHKRSVFRLAINAFLLLSAYGAVAYFVQPLPLLRYVGCGIVLGLMMEDVIILSQHTHVPMPVSNGREVSPVPPLQQEVFTRSLKFPAWFSRLILLNMDAHELHHMYVQVPGYYLHRVPYRPQNEMSWWQWVLRSKRIRGDVLLFQNRDQTGLEI